MPVAQGSSTDARQAVLLAMGAVLAVVTFVFLVTRLGSLGNGGTEVPVQLGEPVFRAGNAQTLADAIDQQEPILLPDTAGGDRDIVVNHLGDDVEAGWVAFAARPLTAPRDCFVQWQPADETFVDRCDGTVYPPDGAGLEHYGITVDEAGDVIINLNIVQSETGGSDS